MKCMEPYKFGLDCYCYFAILSNGREGVYATYCTPEDAAKYMETLIGILDKGLSLKFCEEFQFKLEELSHLSLWKYPAFIVMHSNTMNRLWSLN